MAYFIRIVLVFIILTAIFSFTNKVNDWKGSNDIQSDDAVQNNLTIIDNKFPDNYIDRVIIDGNIIRWNPSTFPLKVYIEDKPELPDYYTKEVEKAFEEWQKASNGLVSFVYIAIKDYSDIRCNFPNNFNTESGNQGMITGNTVFERENGVIKYAQINFAAYNTKNGYFSKKQIYSTALHEIGHSLGINGHSPTKTDIMYPAPSELKISSGDINTLKLLYSIAPDITNKDFPQDVKDKFITTQDIFGEYSTRIDIELQNTKEDINNSTASSNKLLRSANLYLKKEDYDSALENYKKALPLLKDNDTAADVNRVIAFCYIKLKNYNEALGYAQTANNLKNNDDYKLLLASLYYKTGNNEKAKYILKDLLDKNPHYKNAYGYLANIYLKEKDNKSIKDLYNKRKYYFPSEPPIKMK